MSNKAKPIHHAILDERPANTQETEIRLQPGLGGGAGNFSNRDRPAQVFR